MAKWVKGFSIVTVVAWVVAVAWIQFKVQELPCAAGAAIKQNKTKQPLCISPAVLMIWLAL